MAYLGATNSKSKLLRGLDLRLYQAEQLLGGVAPEFELPSDFDIPATEAIWSYELEISIVDANGDPCQYLNNDIGVTVDTDSSAGTASVSDATPALVNGVTTVTVSGDAAAWLADETVTVTVANFTDGVDNTITGGDIVLTVV